jgi:hypothetical protein
MVSETSNERYNNRMCRNLENMIHIAILSRINMGPTITYPPADNYHKFWQIRGVPLFYSIILHIYAHVKTAIA